MEYLDKIKKLKWKPLCVVMMFIFGLIMAGVSIGYYNATGGNLVKDIFAIQSEVTPPSTAKATYDELMVLLKEDKTNELEYRVGWNCIDYTWTVWRSLMWNGVMSGMVAIRFNDGSQHSVLLVPTKDKGIIFIEPQTDRQIEIQVGKSYMGKRIMSVELITIHMVDLTEINHLTEMDRFK